MAATGSLAVHDSGTGPAVLFLHGFPLDASQWDHQVAALSGDYRCVRPDMWGCGSSPAPPDETPTVDGFARTVLGALDERGVERMTVVGLSLGGYIALALHRLAPQRISALVLCNTRATADGDAARTDRRAIAERAERNNDVSFLVEPNVERLLGSGARAEVHVTDPLRGRILRCTAAGVAYAERAMAARPDSTDLLASVACPALVIAGSEDAVIPADDTNLLASRIPGAQLVTLECGHLSNLEVPEEFNATLSRFLAEVPSG